MRPILMIENVKNLHDARYCAAVGIAMATFELDPQSLSALTPAAVAEISAWLSGLDCVGKFPIMDPAELNAQAEQAQIGWAEIPLTFDQGGIAELLPNKIFAVDQLEGSLSTMLRLHADFAEALFLVDAPHPSQASSLWAEADLLSRCILRYDAPDAIYQQLAAQGLQPYGFSLGVFSTDHEGLLDYDACDTFIDQYQVLVPA